MRSFLMLLCTSLTLGISGALAADGPRLYKTYQFGMPKPELQQEAGAYDCSEEFEPGAICVDGQTFAGIEVDLGFQFIEDKLAVVSLFSEFSEENYMVFSGALNSKFQMITIEGGDEKIDLVLQMKTYEQPTFLKNIADFEGRALSNGNIKYTFVDQDVFKSMVGEISNSVELILNAPQDLRSVAYIISAIDDDFAVGIIQFSAPKQILNIMQIKSEETYEDF